MHLQSPGMLTLPQAIILQIFRMFEQLVAIAVSHSQFELGWEPLLLLWAWCCMIMILGWTNKLDLT